MRQQLNPRQLDEIVGEISRNIGYMDKLYKELKRAGAFTGEKVKILLSDKGIKYIPKVFVNISSKKFIHKDWDAFRIFGVPVEYNNSIRGYYSVVSSKTNVDELLDIR